MENLLLGFNIIFPIFFIIFIGFYLKKIHMISENFISVGSDFIFKIVLPAKLIIDIKDADISGLNISYVLYVCIGVCAIFSLSWIGGRIFIKDNAKLATFVHCSYRSNFVYIGIPLLESIYKEPAMDAVIVVLVFGLTLFNILATIVLTYYSGKKLNPIDFVIKIIKNPMIIGIFIGIILKVTKFPLYEGIESGLFTLGKMATPMSLILIGGSLNFSKSRMSDSKLIATCVLIKDAIGAIILVPIAMLLGFSTSYIVVSFILFTCPCAANCFIMTKSMGGDGELASIIVTMSFALSIFTFTIGIAILKSIGII